MANPLPRVTIYTDGACEPNPGPGGWAAILLRAEAKPEELCGAEAETTNNRMELQAVLAALRALGTPHQIVLYSDSQYVIQGLTQGLVRWPQQGWRLSDTKEVKNEDLWKLLVNELPGHQIECRWVQGHSGDPWNERADALAVSMLPPRVLPLQDASAIHLFISASCLDTSDGAGGWAATLRYREATKLLSGGELKATSNRLLLRAAVQGLGAVKKAYPIHLYTNSDYLHAGITRWVKGWVNRGWRTSEGKAVSHRDLWEELLRTAGRYQVQYHLVGETPEPVEMISTYQRAQAEACAQRLAVAPVLVETCHK